MYVFYNSSREEVNFLMKNRERGQIWYTSR